MDKKLTIAVYLSSSDRCDQSFKDCAEQTGKLLGLKGKNLVYGGMSTGLMGRLATSAMAAGSYVTGVVPRKIADSRKILDNLSKLIMVEDLWDRKKRMFLISDAFMVLPGGFGTLDEALEVLHWASDKRHQKPVAFVNTNGYWDKALEFIRSLPDFDERFLIVKDTPEEALETLETWAPPADHTLVSNNGSPVHYPHYEDGICRNDDENITVKKATLQNSYYLLCALGLKQLGKHNKPIGILNDKGQFNSLLDWFNVAAKENFITKKCLRLFTVSKTSKGLAAGLTRLAKQEQIKIDLEREKWGVEPD